MDRIIQKWIAAVLLALVPLAVALAEPPAPESEQAPSLESEQPPSAVVKASMNSVPQAVFPETKFESAPVFEGTEIKHDFMVENKGDAPLIINKIKPD